MDTLKAAAEFFYAHAGYSYHPARETAEQGRKRGARALARAERKARRKGITFSWSIDPDVRSDEFSDEKPSWELYQCAAWDAEGRCVASLRGIDFGREGSPYSDAYARVVQAELALEAINRM